MILASSILENMDQSVEPCDDFYKFACGNFLKNTIIPDDKTSVNTFSIISDKLQKQLRASIEEESKPGDPRAFKIVKTLYKSCMNKSKLKRIKIRCKICSDNLDLQYLRFIAINMQIAKF